MEPDTEKERPSKGKRAYLEEKDGGRTKRGRGIKERRG